MRDGGAITTTLHPTHSCAWTAVDHPQAVGTWDPHLLSQLLQLHVHIRNLLLAVDDHITVFKGLLTSWEGWNRVVRTWIPHALGTSCLRFPSGAYFCVLLPPPGLINPPMWCR